MNDDILDLDKSTVSGVSVAPINDIWWGQNGRVIAIYLAIVVLPVLLDHRLTPLPMASGSEKWTPSICCFSRPKGKKSLAAKSARSAGCAIRRALVAWRQSLD
jgi:hypothetical protein